MRVAIPHSLGRDEVRHRLRARTGELAGFIPGGFAEVSTSWVGEDRMNLEVDAMGQHLSGHVDVEDRQVVFTVDLPPALSFVEPMIAAAIKDNATKLLK